MGQSGVMEMMAAQLGLAKIPLCSRIAPGLISGTTSGTPASIRNADELSTTTAPWRTAGGAKRFDWLPPAENNAMSTPAKLSSVNSSTVTGFPLKGSVLPAERADANNRKLDSGKRRCSRHCINSTPTAPVAPTTATTGADEEGRPDCMLRLPNTHDLMKTIQPINKKAPLGLPAGPLGFGA